MIAAVKSTGGTFLKVSEEEIDETIKEMSMAGFFIEPTSSAVIAGLKQYLTHHATPDEEIVSVTTGHGLKAAGKIGKVMGIS